MLRVTAIIVVFCFALKAIEPLISLVNAIRALLAFVIVVLWFFIKKKKFCKILTNGKRRFCQIKPYAKTHLQVSKNNFSVFVPFSK